MGEDEARKIILARRAKFVAAALVSLNAAMCTDDAAPHPCLTPIYDGSVPPDASVPQPCLAPPPPDASEDAADDADADDGG